MIRIRCSTLIAIATLVTGCGTSPIKYGESSLETSLKQLPPVRDRVSLYVCRVDGSRMGKLRSTVFVNGAATTMLLPRMFGHTLLSPGSHTLYLRNEAPGAMSGTTGELKIEAKAGEVVFVWVGVSGNGWGTLTIDRFESTSEAKKCIEDARFGVLVD